MALDKNMGIYEFTFGETKITAVTEERLLADEHEIKNIFMRISKLIQDEHREQRKTKSK